MADGDITACIIQATGFDAKITIEGWATEQGNIAYDYGTLPASALVTFSLTSQGYTGSVLGTTSRTVYGVATIRKPDPDEAELDEVDSGGDLVVRISLSDSIYDDDTSVTVTLSSAWGTEGANTTNAKTSLACTNSSTLDYPKVIGQWDTQTMRGGWRRMESDFKLGFRARHGHGIAAVVLSCDGASSSHTDTETVTTISTLQSPRSGLYHEAYRTAAFTLADYTQNEAINCRAIAYPLVGDADSILDTNTTTSIYNRIMGNTTLTMHCDKTGALKNYAYVDADSGVDVNGVVSATAGTASATPYLTVGAALADDATVIRVKNTTAVPECLGVAPTTVTDQGFYPEVTQDPDDLGQTLNRPTSTASNKYHCDYLCYEDITINNTGDSDAYFDGVTEEGQLLFSNVVFTGNGTGSAADITYKSRGVWMLNSKITDPENYEPFSSTRNAISFTGCDIQAASTIEGFSTYIGNSSDATLKIRMQAVTPTAPLTENVMMEHNAIMGITQTITPTISFTVNDKLTNFSFIGNILEIKAITGAGPALALHQSTESPLGGGLEHFVVAHNTVVGQRCNWFYNDHGTVSAPITNVFLNGNSIWQHALKTDTFAVASGNRVGNWAQYYGCNFKNNRADSGGLGILQGIAYGIDWDYVTSDALVYGEMGYVDEQSIDVGGAGNGDYTPDTGSTLILGEPLIRPMVGFDLFGTPVNEEIGAVFIAQAGGGTISVKMKFYRNMRT